jgi:hypothetical protein
MPMPSSVPVYNAVQLVQFDVLDRQFVSRPARASSAAWVKLEELERRLDAFDWASMVVREQRRCDTFINDLAFAFVLGFEATLQVLRREKGAKGFDAWLSSLPEYDMPCRGIRTLRNLEAHIQSGQLIAGQGSGVYTRFSNTMTPQPGVVWLFPEISHAEFHSLKPHGRRLTHAELSDWNSHRATEAAANIMRTSLMSLVSIVRAA